MNFTELKAGFQLPDRGIYLNSCLRGLMPLSAIEALTAHLGAGWDDWLGTSNDGGLRAELQRRAVSRIARLVGAEPDDLALGPPLQVQFLQALTAALSLCTGPVRRVIVTDSSLSASELRAIAQIAAALGCQLRIANPSRICYALSEEVAVLFLSEIDQITGEKRDLPCLTRLAHDAGALTIWELSHSAGVTAPDLGAANADFAIGGTEGYLCGGPGAPGYLWISPRFRDRISPIFASGDGVTEPYLGEGLTNGTSLPSLADLALLDAALANFDAVSPLSLQGQAAALGTAFIAALDQSCPGLSILTPRDPARRGGHISLSHPHAARLLARLGEAGLSAGICGPDTLRFSFSPLYNDLGNAEHAAVMVAEAIAAEVATRETE